MAEKKLVFNSSKAIFKIITLIIIVLFIFSYFSFVFAEDSVNTPDPYTGQYGVEGSYTLYYDKYKNEIKPDVTMAIPAMSFSVTNGTDAKIQDFKGQKNILVWNNQDGNVEWNVVINQSGLYNMSLDYYTLEGNGGDIEFELSIDDNIPFNGANSISFPRLFKDKYSIPQQDNKGNDIRSPQVEVNQWMSEPFLNNEGLTNDPYLFYFSKGVHTIKLTSVKEPIAIKQINIYNEKQPPSYQQYKNLLNKNNTQGSTIVLEAEKTLYTTSSMIYSVSDRSDPGTTPCDPVKVRLNTIGGDNWALPNQTISWSFDVPKDGFYNIGFRYKQNYIRGLFVSRKVKIDGSVPFKELEAVKFDYGVDWNYKILGDNNPYQIFLKKGEHQISMSVTLGDMSSLLSDVGYGVYSLNALYRKIIMITGAIPDIYRDYNLQVAVPDLISTMKKDARLFRGVEQSLYQITKHKGSEASMLDMMSNELDSFIAQPNTIPSRLSSFQTNVFTLAAWILQIKNQKLLLDKIYISPESTPIQEKKSSFFEKIAYQVKGFFGSFFEDYSSIGNVYDKSKSVYVWINSGRDQAEVLKSLIDNSFTPQSGITVNLSLVQGGLTQAVMAGKGPDVALMIGRGDPINLALREAVIPLQTFSGFSDNIKHYMNNAMIPYCLNGNYYALPETQNFFMMFYRTDIFNALNIKPPDTWNDFYDVAEVLQRNNMNVGIPYVSLDAYSVVSQGMGALNIFLTLIMQNGGNIYNKNLNGTELNTTLSNNIFKQYTDLYTQYGFPLFKDDYNRFRTGEMPLDINVYTFYNMLDTAAPEIKNMWSMVPIPGTVQSDGTVNRTEAASGTACVILSATKNKKASWDFINWWTQANTQGEYGKEIESILGAAGRYNPANIDALKQIPWSGSELKVIMSQWRNVKEIPEIPGGYYVSRNIDNAFRAVIYNNENPREALNYWNQQNNEEIIKKLNEFGLNDKEVSLNGN